MRIDVSNMTWLLTDINREDYRGCCRLSNESIRACLKDKIKERKEWPASYTNEYMVGFLDALLERTRGATWDREILMRLRYFYWGSK